MPADQTTPDPGDRSNLCLTLTASVQANGKCGRVVRISRWASTSLWPPARSVTE